MCMTAPFVFSLGCTLRRRRLKVADMLGFTRAQCSAVAELEALMPIT